MSTGSFKVLRKFLFTKIYFYFFFSRSTRTPTELTTHVKKHGRPRIPESSWERVSEQPYNRRTLPRIRPKARVPESNLRRTRLLPRRLLQPARKHLRGGRPLIIHGRAMGSKYPILREPAISRSSDPPGGRLAGVVYTWWDTDQLVHRGRPPPGSGGHARGQHARGEDRHYDGGYQTTSRDHGEVSSPARVRGGTSLFEGGRSFQIR